MIILKMIIMFLGLIIVGSNCMSSELKINIFPFDKNLSVSSIKSASEYIILKHLNKNIIDIEKDGSIVGDLAIGWKISKDYKVFTFQVRENQKYSNGELLTVDNIVTSFNSNLKSKTTIHFDFNKIKKIEKLSNSEFRIILKESMPRFISKLAHPEFGILYPGEENYKVTSGCYSLLNIETNRAELKVNEFCTDLKNKVTKIIFSYFSPEQLVKKIENNELDFCVSFFEDDKDFYDKISKNKNFNKFTPHIGFTYWLSFNSASNPMKNLEIRNLITNVIKAKPLVTDDNRKTWDEAWQLFLPNGPGRLTAIEENTIWKKKLSSKNQNKKIEIIKILLPKSFYLNNELLSRLEKVSLKVEPIYYENQNDFILKLKNNPDLYLMNNDFSSLDLEDSLFVTFNKNRPLINANKDIELLLNQLPQLTDENDVYNLYRKIAVLVLSENLIIPLVHKRIIFFKKKSLNLNEWSTIFPEISAWKIIK